MTPEQLKSSILQYAIQGKLVEQRPEEGTGEELYQQIQTNLDAISEVQTKKKNKILPIEERMFRLIFQKPGGGYDLAQLDIPI